VSVTNTPRGTAYRHFGAHPPSYTIAGKTGTAQVFTIAQGEEGENFDHEALPKHLQDNSLFIGFAPVNNPQVAIAVVIENSPGTATEVARKVLDYYFKNPLMSKNHKAGQQ